MLPDGREGNRLLRCGARVGEGTAPRTPWFVPQHLFGVSLQRISSGLCHIRGTDRLSWRYHHILTIWQKFRRAVRPVQPNNSEPLPQALSKVALACVLSHPELARQTEVSKQRHDLFTFCLM